MGNVWRNQSFGVVWGRIDSLGTIRISNGKNMGGEGRKKYTSAIELACHDLRKGVKGTNLPLTKERLSVMGKTLRGGGWGEKGEPRSMYG